MTLWERVVGNRDPWIPNDRLMQRDAQELRKRLEEAERLLTARVEREVARLGAKEAESVRRVIASAAQPPKLRDKLERSRPVQNESRQRDMARLPVYRFAALASTVLIVGMLVIAFRVIEAAQT